jgi:hypothetical protein
MISAVQFSEDYNCFLNLIHTYRKEGNKHIHKLPDGVYVDDAKLLKRRDFYIKIWLLSHDNYYKITEHITEAKLACILARYTEKDIAYWKSFLLYKLFSPSFRESNLLLYEIKYNYWAFFRVTTFLIRRIEKRFK